ncbi:hypothetical protein GEA64_21395 [Photorhabdus khanii]|uniref:Uncharacterized protein n=1 Tax=Photorhabdus khanii TaxID=1004150 RepID=A0A7C9GS65_9GAMM|nr:hypothetical protein [Photorhabdus khanii]MQL50350.1 hypothetical protein [Photorhabdus khanii]
MSYTYNSHGIWNADLTVTYGDVFYVTPDDHAKNSNLTTGDYYLALYDGPIIAYPASGQSDAHWKYVPASSAPWVDVNNVRLDTDMGETATIFANGLQMTPVYVYFTLGDDSGKMTIDSLTALAYQNTTLIDYNTGKPLTRVDFIDPDHRVPTNGWYFCTKANDFVTTNANRGSNYKDVTAASLIFYVACQSRSQTAKKIGASIQPSGAPDPFLDSLYGKFHSSVSITAMDTPSTKAGSSVESVAAVAPWVSVDPSPQPHPGQGSDDGSDYAKGPNYKNLWRQNNFIIRPMLNGAPAKIQEVRLYDNTEKKVNFNDSRYHIYSDSTRNGFNTRCYIFNVNAKNNTPVPILGNVGGTLSNVSWTDAVCITWLTQYFPVSMWESDTTKPVSVEIIDVHGNSYYFAPVLPHKISYNRILNIVSNAGNDPSQLIIFGKKAAERPNYDSPTSVNYFNIYETKKNMYLRYDSDHHHYILQTKTNGDRAQWYFTNTSSTAVYNMNIRNNANRIPVTKDKPQTDWMTHEGDIDIYTKSYLDKNHFFSTLLAAMLNPIWNASDGNQFQILSNAQGYDGWVRCDNDGPSRMRLGMTNGHSVSVFRFVPAG